MRKKPTGRKYRNLIRIGDRIYYERVVEGRRIRISTNRLLTKPEIAPHWG